MTKQLIIEAIEKLEQAQETLRVPGDNNQKPLQFLVNSQKHYEISRAISELKYVLETI